MSIDKTKFLPTIAAAVAALSATSLAFYPEQRVCHWFEFLTDGAMPKPFANLAQDTLSSMWRAAYAADVVEAKRSPPKAHRSSGKSHQSVSSALVEYLTSDSSGSSGEKDAAKSDISNKVIVELAAGAGAAPALLVEKLRAMEVGETSFGLHLTDLQPNTHAWSDLQNKHGDWITFEAGSVDATNVRASAPSASTNVATPATESAENQRSLRMIHLALHHFPEPLVQGILADVVRTDSALLIVDLAPTRGGVLWNWLLPLKSFPRFERVRQSVSDFLGDEAYSFKEKLWFFVAYAPFSFTGFHVWHDATVSVLRSYSVAQVETLLSRASAASSGASEAQKKYVLRTFYSGSFADWLELPEWAGELLPGMADPVIQYVLVAPA